MNIFHLSNCYACYIFNTSTHPTHSHLRSLSFTIVRSQNGLPPEMHIAPHFISFRICSNPSLTEPLALTALRETVPPLLQSLYPLSTPYICLWPFCPTGHKLPLWSEYLCPSKIRTLKPNAQ